MPKVLAALVLTACAVGVAAQEGLAPPPAPDAWTTVERLRIQPPMGDFSEIEFDSAAAQPRWLIQATTSYIDFYDYANTTRPLSVAAATPNYTLVLHPGGVCVNCTSSGSKLYVYSDNPSTSPDNARLVVREGSATTGSRNMLRLINNGASTIRFDNTATGAAFGFGSMGTGNFFIAQVGQPLALVLTPAGDLTIGGALTQMSDKNAKHDIAPVDGRDVLARVAALPLSTWTYKTDTTGARHLGPMAQDFAAAFQLGSDDTHIAPSDLAGVSLAAVQELRAELLARDELIRALEQRLGALEARGR